ncbi:MAG TPA: hypothetical protein VFW92_07370 [Candidatus Limnocylindrales bacterium]|nr:hypothetical protein [Candidatus Limnocylindrales bacterium]
MPRRLWVGLGLLAIAVAAGLLVAGQPNHSVGLCSVCVRPDPIIVLGGSILAAGSAVAGLLLLISLISTWTGRIVVASSIVGAYLFVVIQTPFGPGPTIDFLVQTPLLLALLPVALVYDSPLHGLVLGALAVLVVVLARRHPLRLRAQS